MKRNNAERITDEHRERWERFTRTGCIACYLEGYPFRAFERHHLVEGYRLGHRFTVPLCRWHHRGAPDQRMDETECRLLYGPSMALEKQAFVEHFGTERELCEKVDDLIGWEPPEWPQSKILARGGI